MEILRKVSLALGCAASAVCCLFLNLAGGYALYSNNYQTIGISLMVSTGLLVLSLIAAFFRKGIFTNRLICGKMREEKWDEFTAFPFAE